MNTYHTYPDLLITGGRLAITEWPDCSEAEAVAATLRYDSEAVILQCGETRGLAPGGINCCH
jgi:hypothetical protein